jgi:hypothetical protein
MNTIRKHPLTKASALITGVVFLNMSFFLAEVSMLKYEKKELIEIAKLLLNTGFEEERDTSGGSAGADNLSKVVELGFVQAQVDESASYLISTTINRTIVDHYRHANHSLTFFPPPDLA